MPGILLTAAGALLLVGGILLVVGNATSTRAFDFFWMPFVGGGLLFVGIFMWTFGNLARRSAQFAAGTGMMPGLGGPGIPTSNLRICQNCGNANPATAVACSTCGRAF